MTRKRLTAKQQAFVNEYLKCRNASEAARRAGYSEKSASTSGDQNMHNPAVRHAIDSVVSKLTPTATDIIEGLARGRQSAKPDSVYLIRESFYGLIKIGIAVNIQQRLASLQTSCPQELIIVDYLNTEHALRVESNLHKRFEKKNVRGEWYQLTDMDVRTIRDEWRDYRKSTEHSSTNASNVLVQPELIRTY